MTTIAYKKNADGSVTIASDTQTTAGWHKFPKEAGSTIPSDMGKIYKVNGMLIGAAGFVSESNLLKLFALNHQPRSAEEDSVLDFIVEFRQWVAKKTGENSYSVSNHLVIVFKSKIFEIKELDVREVKEFGAIGSGMFLALAALHFGKSVEAAVDVAKIYDLYSGGETQLLTSDPHPL